MANDDRSEGATGAAALPGRGRMAGVAPVLAAAALFGTTGAAQALGPAGTTALGVGAIRLVTGALVLAAVAVARRPPEGRRWWRHAHALVIGGVAVATYQLAWFAGLRRTGVALGTIVAVRLVRPWYGTRTPGPLTT